MPVYTFLEEYDFSGKTIIPFASHEGSGLGNGPSKIAEICPNAQVMDGFSARGTEVSSSKDDIEKWIDGLNLEQLHEQKNNDKKDSGYCNDFIAFYIDVISIYRS